MYFDRYAAVVEDLKAELAEAQESIANLESPGKPADPPSRGDDQTTDRLRAEVEDLKSLLEDARTANSALQSELESFDAGKAWVWINPTPRSCTPSLWLRIKCWNIRLNFACVNLQMTDVTAGCAQTAGVMNVSNI